MFEIFWNNLSVTKRLYGQCLEPVHKKYDLTRMELDILLFLANNPSFNTAADIVRMRCLTKSHVSTSVKNLAAKGYLEKFFTTDNQKAIRLKLSSLAFPIIEDGRSAQERFGEYLLSGFSKAERAAFFSLFTKLDENIRNLPPSGPPSFSTENTNDKEDTSC